MCLGMEFSQSSNIHTSEKVQEVGVHLLEEAWFFGNSLDTKTKVMSRCYSDPCPSSNLDQEKLVKKSKKKISKNNDEFVQRGLIRTPFLPTSLGMGEFSRENEKFSEVKKSSSRPKLARAPSLPPCAKANEEEDDDDQESEFTMGRLIRQASLNSSHMLPPRQNSKTQSISIPRQHQMKKAELQSTYMEDCKDQRNQNPIQITEKKIPIDVEFEDLKGFKDLGLKIEKEDINPKSMVNKISAGLQQKTRVDQLGERKLRKKQQQHQQPWLTKSYSPPPSIPGWVDKSSAEDFKAQIKFWARAVASNVRQEC